jgi:hypothetical protein
MGSRDIPARDDGPVVGRENGPMNTQGKQLANRTKWLKAIADEVVGVRGGKENLDAQLDQYDAYNPDAMGTLIAAAALGLDRAGMANREALKTVRQRIQTGLAVVTNRGVISGCVVSRSAAAVRNLSVTAGRYF